MKLFHQFFPETSFCTNGSTIKTIASRGILKILIVLFVIFNNQNIEATTGNVEKTEGAFEEIVIKTEYGDFTASFFNATGKQAIVFIPGSLTDKESWYFLTHKFQLLGIASLAYDDISGPAIIGGIEYLVERGYRHISLIGGSRGAGVALIMPNHPMITKDLSQFIQKMILIAPFGGDGSDREDIEKLFIIGDKDGVSMPSTIRVYEESAKPKLLKILPDTAHHAQRVFDSKHRDDLIKTVIEFIQN